MTTLDELRRWARGEPIEGLPSKAPKAPTRIVEPPRLTGAGAITGRVSGKYKIDPECTDALLLFGAFRGQKLSQLVDTPRGRKYLRWIIDSDFAEDLKAVCRYRLELKRAK